MMTPALFTAEQFVAERDELPDGGRWTELIAGKPVTLSPPTIEHGTAVLNLSKALAKYSQQEQGGYSCFELGLVIARDPDSVRFPAICVFTTGPLFAEADKVVTEARPSLIVEVASTIGAVQSPAFINPALAPDIVAMPVGQGHSNYTRYASGRGQNPIEIVAPVGEASTGALAWAATRVKITRVGDPDGKLILFSAAGELREKPFELEKR